MADFDSANKRYSGLGFGLDFMRVRPIPDNDIGTADRLHFLPLYAGVAAGLPTGGGTGDVRRRMYPGRPIWRRWRSLFKQGS